MAATYPLAGSGQRGHTGSGYTDRMSEPTFFKSSYSGGGNNCVEIAFHKSSYSGSSDTCVEVAETPTATLIRDTQNRSLGHIDITPREWSALIRTC